ncbi:hypothetical protein AVEN_203466-1 [Araneus ventricosus]|uniref:Uncharacterized protein n=1 Tax=Araneus ventricosus TaxID=182803 RepID=A0A4Y2BGD4_ARAVE|nr:hypothetical protein AVEN_203466-1 [Araneus ventricosus]
MQQRNDTVAGIASCEAYIASESKFFKHLLKVLQNLLSILRPTCYRQAKTLSGVASNRRVEERRDTDIKSTATFGKLSALPLGEEFVFERSRKKNETSARSICAK